LAIKLKGGIMILTINREILMKLINSGRNFKMIDVQDEECYRQEHIKGAISVPYDKMERLADNRLNKDDFVIIYSKNIHCNKSLEAAIKLENKGFDKIYVYREGIEDYKNNYLPLEVIFLPDMSSMSYG
jgi:rhodanese-related sulfurtransferase